MIFLKEDWAAGCGDKSFVFHLAEAICWNRYNKFPSREILWRTFPEERRRQGGIVLLRWNSVYYPQGSHDTKDKKDKYTEKDK